MVNTYLSYKLIVGDMTRAIDRVEKQPTVDRETKYYLANIGKVATVDDFMKDDRLYRYAMKAYGLEDMTYAKAFMAKVLKEGISDPDSFANRLNDKRYAEFAAAFNFEKYGASATSYNRVQDDVPKGYATQVKIAGLANGFSEFGEETGYYLTHIGDVHSIDDLMADDRLLTFAMAAYGLDSETEAPERVRAMLEGGVLDPASPANALGDKRYANFVSAFNFVESGAATTGRDVVQKDVPKLYRAGTGLLLVPPNADYIKTEAEYFKANISKVKTVTDFLANQRLLTFAMATYGLDAATEKPKTIRAMIEGGIRDPASPANLLSDPRYANFVAAFDFEQFGDQATSRASAVTDTAALWTSKSNLGWIKPSDTYVKTETDYYLANVSQLHSIDDLMSNKRLLDFALFSYGLDPTTEKPETVRKMLEGGVSDPASPANALTDKRYAAFVSAFNFAGHGEETTTYAAAQQPVVDKYLRQTLEQDAGKDNEGVRLALYFERKSPTITSFYSILADKALAKVIYTVLGLPDSFATADIDKQVAFFESKFDIEDFQDADKLGDFLKRFTALWEVNNSSSPAQASVSVLFGQPTEYGISTDLLFTMQRMKF